MNRCNGCPYLLQHKDTRCCTWAARMNPQGCHDKIVTAYRVLYDMVKRNKAKP